MIGIGGKRCCPPLEVAAMQLLLIRADPTLAGDFMKMRLGREHVIHA